MSVQFNAAVSLAQHYNLPPPPDPKVDPDAYGAWLETTAAPYVAEPGYHPQLAGLLAANDGGAGAVPFADQVRGQDPQPTTDMDLALLAQDVYQASSTDAIGSGGWTRVDELPPGISTPLSSDASGFQAAIYTDGDGRYVLAFAGTDATSIPDWLNNGQQALGFESSQYRDAIALAKEASAEWGDDLVITGHSLGGGLASAASLASGNPAVTFNASGLSDQTMRDLGFTPNGAREIAADGQIRRYNVENDILTGAQQGSALPDAIGYELRLDNTYLIKDPIRAHMMDAVLRGLEHGNVTPVETSPAERAMHRPGEAALDLAGNVLREGGGLVGDTASNIGELAGDVLDAGRTAADGRPVEAVIGLGGDVAESGLQLLGDVTDRGLNVAGSALHSGGSLLGGLIRDGGQMLGVEGAGNTLGGWVEQGTQWAGDRLDDAGSWLGERLEGAGSWLSDAAADAGSWANDRVTDAANWAADRISDVGSWTADRASDVGNWAGDRWNDFKQSNWNPGNWF